MPGLNPLGGEVRVNPTADGAQVGATVIGLAGGNYLVLWYDVTVSNEDSTFFLNGRLFAAGGAAVGDISLGAVYDPTQGAVFASAALVDGGFAVVYAPSGSNQLRVQRFDSSGASLGEPILQPLGVPLDTPSLAAHPDGGFYAVYDATIEGDIRLVGMRYGPDGVAIGGRFEIADDYSQPATTVLANGDLLVAWEDLDDSQSGSNIHARIFSPEGLPRGPEIAVDVEAVRARTNAAVTSFDDGRFAVTWWDRTDDAVLVRLFAASGSPLGDAVAVDPDFVGEKSSAQVIDTGNDGFLVTYVADGKDGDGRGLFGRRFDAGGQPVGEPQPIAQTSAGDQSSGISNVAMLADGSFAFSWYGQGDQPGQTDDLGVFIRRFELEASSNVPSAGNDVVVGTSGGDLLFLQQGGNDSASGGDGSDGFFFGAAFTPADSVDGGSGADTLALQGNYAGLGLGSVSAVELIALFSGSDTRFGDIAGNLYDYSIIATDSNVAAGGLLQVIATGLRPGEDLVFDGSAETDGAIRVFAGRGNDTLSGGGGDDGFFFGAEGNLTGADRVTGGGGTDTIALRGNYVEANAVTFAETSMSTVEVLTFLSSHTNEYGGVITSAGFDYSMTMADGNVAAGQQLEVIGSTLRGNEQVRFDGRAELDGSFRILMGAGDDMVFGSQGADILHGALGADQIDGSGGADTYLYRAAAESTALSSDTIVLDSGDRIDLSFIDANGNAGDGDQAFTFIGSQAFANVAGQLRAVQSGGAWVVEADVDGNGLADMVINVATPLTITAETFIP